MQLKITHVTGFAYDSLVSASYNEARMTPLTDASQTVRHSRIEVSPHPWTQTYRDYWGAEVTAFEVLDPHRELTVTASSTVRTEPRTAPVAQADWADLLEPALVDELTEYLGLVDRVRPPAELSAQVAAIAADVARPGELAREVCRLVHDEVAHQPGSTDVHALAATAWAQRAGVCQDLAHLVVGALRERGIPSRYVSGYVLPVADPAIGAEAPAHSHAWVEWWDHGWQAFDPSLDQPPGEQHVTVASGRDYADVRPLSGVYAGAAASEMFVDVRIARLD